MKIEDSERHMLNNLIQKKRHSKDPFASESLNQYVKDLRIKYHISINGGVDLMTGEIQEGKEK